MKNLIMRMLRGKNTFHCLLVVTLLFIMGCNNYDKEPDFENLESIKGYKPLYKSSQELQEIKAGPPQPLVNPGKIYVYRNFLFVNEIGEGVHVIDNTNPADPKPYSFIAIEGNVDISIKDEVLYADNHTDLVAINISNVANISVSARIEDVFNKQSFMP